MAELVRKFRHEGSDTLSLPAERGAFATLKTWLSDIAEELNLAEKTKKQLLIAADEIFTNIAGYGYPCAGGTAEVQVEIEVPTRRLRLTFFDSGVAYNPLENAAPDVSKPLSERCPGGLGIFMVKKLMDSVRYQRENGQNVLILEKILDNDSSKGGCQK